MKPTEMKTLSMMEKVFKKIIEAVVFEPSGEIDEADLEDRVLPNRNRNAPEWMQVGGEKMIIDLARNMSHPDEGYLVRVGTKYRIGPSVKVKREPGQKPKIETIQGGSGKMVLAPDDPAHLGRLAFERKLIYPDNGRGRSVEDPWHRGPEAARIRAKLKDRGLDLDT